MNNRNKYTEQELIDATQIAYLKCAEGVDKNNASKNDKDYKTIRDIILSNMDIEKAKSAAKADGYNPEKMSLQHLALYSDLDPSDKAAISKLSNESLNWKIVDTHDRKSANGFYGCVIETSPNNAIVAFRGSEGIDSYDGLINDWVKNDFGLLNSMETEQQKETEKYTDELIKSGKLDKYNSLAASGHSLGGNLASHFAVATASKNTRKPIFNKLNQVANFDGPGYSDEYIDTHQNAIKRASSKITHYKWSPVGDLLYDLPGEKEVILTADKDKIQMQDDNFIKKLGHSTFGIHDVGCLVKEDDGSYKRGKKKILSRFLSGVSEKADSGFGGKAISGVRNTIGKYTSRGKDGSTNISLSGNNRTAREDVIEAAAKDSNYNTNGINGFISKVKDFFDRHKNKENTKDPMLRA